MCAWGQIKEKQKKIIIQWNRHNNGKGTILSLAWKELESWTEVEVVTPMLFMRRLETTKTRGVVRPSPMAPMKPRVIRNLSTASACMKIDAIHQLLFFLFRILPSKSPFSFPIFFFTFPLFLGIQTERTAESDDWAVEIVVGFFFFLQKGVGLKLNGVVCLCLWTHLWKNSKRSYIYIYRRLRPVFVTLWIFFFFFPKSLCEGFPFLFYALNYFIFYCIQMFSRLSNFKKGYGSSGYDIYFQKFWD